MLCLIYMHSPSGIMHILGKALLSVLSRLMIAKKKEHTRPLSELFTCSTALKFANALAKLPLKLSLSYHKPYYIESINQEWRKSAPSFLSTSHCEFYSAVRASTSDEPSLPTRFACYSRISTFIV